MYSCMELSDCMTQNRSIREHIFYFYKIFLKITRACAEHLVIPISPDHTLTANKNLALSWIYSISVRSSLSCIPPPPQIPASFVMFLQQILQLPPLSPPIFPSPPPLSSLNMFCPSIFLTLHQHTSQSLYFFPMFSLKFRPWSSLRVIPCRDFP